MVWLFVCVYAVLIVLVYLMARVLKKSVDKISEQSKSYYINKLQEYDELIDEKEKKLDDLNDEIKNKKVEIESIKSNMVASNVDFDISIIDVLSRTKYQDKGIFEIEKMINDEFNYNAEKIILEFVKQCSTKRNYEFCKKLRRKFSPKKIYELSILEPAVLDVKLNKMLDENEYKILEVYRDTNKKFKLKEFLIYLDELVELNNPTITVYVGSKQENYDFLDKNIKTKIDKNIYRGIKIVFQSKLYDFSLNGRNL